MTKEQNSKKLKLETQNMQSDGTVNIKTSSNPSPTGKSVPLDLQILPLRGRVFL